MASDLKSHILILHPDDERVFTLDGKHLPSLSRSVLGKTVNDWNLYVQNLLKLPFQVVLLRRECYPPDSETECSIYIFEIPHTDVPNVGCTGTWVAKEEVPHLSKDPSTDLATDYLRNYAVHGLDINSDRLLPFSKRGWFDNTRVWTSSVLSEAGFKLEELQQYEVGNASFILRAYSQCGAKFYVKACYPTGIYNEATVTMLLGTEMPDDFARPLGVDMERNVVLMNDLGSGLGTIHNEDIDAESRNGMLTTWGQIQLRSIAKRKQLVEGGLPVWDTKTFQSMIEDMFGDAEFWSCLQESMSEEERAKYDWATCKGMFLARVEDFYRKIEQYNVPFSLVHGDLNESNVLVREDSKPAFIDLSYTVWSFPFFDVMLVDDDDDDEVDEICCYLELWSNYESMDRLKELYKITVAFRFFYISMRFYHMFKYAEGSRRDCDRSTLATLSDWFEEE